MINSKNHKKTVNSKITKIANELKQAILQKYSLMEMQLFGSHARGDAKKESDIDIFIRLPQVTRQIEEDIFDMTYELELKYDYIIDIIVLEDSLLQSHTGQIPFYQNVLKDGVLI